jgi:hypothetical protein
MHPRGCYRRLHFAPAMQPCGRAGGVAADADAAYFDPVSVDREAAAEHVYAAEELATIGSFGVPNDEPLEGPRTLCVRYAR